jgi:hypothetical protein
VKEKRLVKPQGAVLKQYLISRAPVQIIIGPLGSGKTITTCDKVVGMMCEQEPNNRGVRPSRWVAARNTYGELFTTTIKDWMEVNGGLGTFNQGGKQPPTHTLKFALPDGTRVESELIFISFDRPDHVKKARGLQLTGVWLNEVKELSKPVVDMLDLRHGRYPSKKDGVEPTWHGMLGDCNAPDEDHWLYHLAEEAKPDGWDIFKQPGGLYREGEHWIVNENAENKSNLPPDYYLRGMQGKSDDWIRVNLANEYGFVSDGKPVHPRYVDSVHCKDWADWKPSTEKDIVIGFDFGRTPAAALLQETAFGGWVAFDEFVTHDMSAISFAPELGKYLRRHYPNNQFRGHGDPAGGDGNQATDETPIKILNAAGIPCKATKTNDPLVRRSAVEVPLREVGMDGVPRLIILPKCTTMRKGLAGGFCYKRVQVAGDERYHDKPDKNKYSHIVEALEYGLQGEGEGRDILKSKDPQGYDDWNQAVNY